MNSVTKVYKKLVSKFTGTSIANWVTGGSAPGKKKAEYVQAYAGWMYIAADTVATDFAQIDLRLKQVDSKGNILDDITNTIRPELAILENPNNAMTGTELKKLTQVYLGIQGKAFWFVSKGTNNEPIGLLPLMPYRVEVVLQKDPINPVKGYVYTDEKGARVPIDPDEMIYFRDIDPRDPLKGGYAAAEAVAYEIDTSEYAKEFNRDFFFNGATLSGTLTTDQTLDDDQFNKLRHQWNKRYSGRENSHKTAILHKGLTYNTIGVSHRDMSFSELSKDTRDSILAAFKVPKTAVGIVEDVNRANAEATDYVFSKRTINPKQKSFVDRLNKFYLPLFKSGISVRFEHVDQTPRDTIALVDENTRLVQSGIKTPNEAREVFKLSPLQNGDQTYMPMGMIASDTVKSKGVITIRDAEVVKESKKKDSVQKKQQKNKEDSVVILTAKSQNT